MGRRSPTRHAVQPTHALQLTPTSTLMSRPAPLSLDLTKGSEISVASPMRHGRTKSRPSPYNKAASPRLQNKLTITAPDEQNVEAEQPISARTRARLSARDKKPTIAKRAQGMAKGFIRATIDGLKIMGSQYTDPNGIALGQF